MLSYDETKYHRIACFISLLCFGSFAATPPTAVELKLVGYGNSSSGIEVQVLSSSQNFKLQISQQIYSKTINGLYLSLQCGQNDNVLNCGGLTTIDQENISSNTIVIVPMVNSILLTRMAYDSKTNALQLSEDYFVDIPLCQQPLAVVQTESMPGVWMLCINGYSVYLFRINLDLVTLEKSDVVGPLAQYPLFDAPTQLSNVIVATVLEEDYLYFAIGDSILQVSIEEQVIYKISYGLCSYITLLQFVDYVLLAYCSDSSILYLDTDGSLISSFPPSLTSSVLVPCTNFPSVYMLLFAKASNPYITYTLLGSNLTGSVDLSQWIDDLNSWVCFGSGDMVHFAFADNLHGVLAVTIYLKVQCGNDCIKIVSLDSTTCANNCKPLVVLKERWIVFQRVAGVGDSLVRVFDSSLNFSTIIEASHININLYTLLEYPPLNSHTISDSTTISFYSSSTQPSEVPTKHNKSSKTINTVLAVASAVVAFLVIIIICIVLSVVSNHQSRLCRKRDTDSDVLQLTKHDQFNLSPPIQVSSLENTTTPLQETETQGIASENSEV